MTRCMSTFKISFSIAIAASFMFTHVAQAKERTPPSAARAVQARERNQPASSHAAQEEEQNYGSLNIGVDVRSVSAVWYTYPSTSTEEYFNLTGIRAEWQYHFIKKSFSLAPGIGLGYFFTGSYDFWRNNTMDSDSAVKANEIDLFSEFGYRVAKQITLLGRVGLAHIWVNADGKPGSFAPYKYSFSDEITDIYIAPGIGIDLTKRLAVTGAYRLSMTAIDVTTDYTVGGYGPSNEKYSNEGFQVKLAWKF